LYNYLFNNTIHTHTHTHTYTKHSLKKTHLNSKIFLALFTENGNYKKCALSIKMKNEKLTKKRKY